MFSIDVGHCNGFMNQFWFIVFINFIVVLDRHLSAVPTNTQSVHVYFDSKLVVASTVFNKNMTNLSFVFSRYPLYQRLWSVLMVINNVENGRYLRNRSALAVNC